MGIASLLYVSNWYPLFGHDSVSPLSHTWSLSIEEQWYLVWPLLLAALLFVSRARTRVVMVLIGSFAVASFVLMTVFFHAYGWARAYFGTDTRASELLVGALLAVVMLGRGSPRTRTARRTLEIAGVLSLVWGRMDDHGRHPVRRMDVRLGLPRCHDRRRDPGRRVGPADQPGAAAPVVVATDHRRRPHLVRRLPVSSPGHPVDLARHTSGSKDGPSLPSASA